MHAGRGGSAILSRSPDKYDVYEHRSNWPEFEKKKGVSR